MLPRQRQTKLVRIIKSWHSFTGLLTELTTFDHQDFGKVGVLFYLKMCTHSGLNWDQTPADWAFRSADGSQCSEAEGILKRPEPETTTSLIPFREVKLVLDGSQMMDLIQGNWHVGTRNQTTNSEFVTTEPSNEPQPTQEQMLDQRVWHEPPSLGV